MRPLPLRLLPALCLLVAGVAAAAAPAAGGKAVPATAPKSIAAPLWEFGLYNFVASIPHYPGSDQSQVYAFPTPFFTYRGKYLRATREGVRGIFYQGPYLETSLSLSGNPPVNTSNRARAGMPGLDAIGEIGPSVKWFFLGRHPLDQLYLQLSARAAASIGFSGGAQMRYQGLAGGLGAVYLNRSRFLARHVRFHLGAGLNFADREYNGYFYNVSPTYATPERPVYRSAAGLSDAYLSASVQYDLNPRVSFGSYARWDTVADAVFADSPLVKQTNNFVVGAVVILRLFRSSTMVSSDDFE
ncbi:MipA/OmpV family protein [uncultured Thiodictyon sp.]|uniref:MipA/OmpV family protein n=1 Tax=uncultured Thiodictyon sp. TaxID=1846217 RepID=UPI0025EFAF2D|nr:MipA/OmpV family protein [uncultured Thiodictyon sp.]